MAINVLVQKLCKAASSVKESLRNLAAAAAAAEEEVPYEALRNDDNLGTPTHRFGYSLSSSSEEESSTPPPLKVPKGFLPVLLAPHYRTCYVIRASLLSHPLLAHLLQLSAQEFGYSHAGALKLPCDSHHFEELLSLINFSKSPVEIIPPLAFQVTFKPS